MDQYGDNQNYTGNNNPNYRPTPPKTWLVESILVTLFCCLPFGIVGIIKAASVESAFYAGRIEEAERASREARKWTLIGFWIGMASLLIYVIMWAVLFAFGIAGGVFNAFTFH